MARRKIKNRVRVNLTLEADTYKEIVKLAAKRGESIPDVIRMFVDEGMTIRYEVENIDLITRILREQLNAQLAPAVERLAALSSKACIQSATAAYLSAEAINKFVPLEYQEDYEAVYEKARKKGVAYLRSKRDGE